MFLFADIFVLAAWKKKKEKSRSSTDVPSFAWRRAHMKTKKCHMHCNISQKTIIHRKTFFKITLSFIKSDLRVPHFLQLIPPYDHIRYLFLPRWPATGRWRPDPEQRPEDWRELFDRRVGSCQEEPRQRPHVAVRCVFLLVEPAAWFRVTRAPINKLIFPFFACTDESSYLFFRFFPCVLVLLCKM